MGFWFAGPADEADHINRRIETWFNVDAEFDAAIREKFKRVVENAADGRYDHWSATARGALAIVIVLDQFPRNIYRKTPRAFATDERALDVCRDGIARGIDLELTLFERTFFYMPFEHAEDIDAQDLCVDYYERLLETATAEFRDIARRSLAAGKAHREVIRRFGRFPHRNSILGREPTTEEAEWYAVNAAGWGQGDADGQD